jgi:hypothetical protein
VYVITRAARNVRARDHTKTQKATLPRSTAMPVNARKRAIPHAVPTAFAQSGDLPTGGVRRGADLERERALHRMRVGRGDAPRHHVGPVAQRVAGRRAHSVAGGLRGWIGRDAITLLVVEPDATERDRDRLVELERDRIGRRGEHRTRCGIRALERGVRERGRRQHGHEHHRERGDDERATCSDLHERVLTM